MSRGWSRPPFNPLSASNHALAHGSAGARSDNRSVTDCDNSAYNSIPRPDELGDRVLGYSALCHTLTRPSAFSRRLVGGMVKCRGRRQWCL